VRAMTNPPGPVPPFAGARRGTAAFRGIAIGLVLAGFSTFSLLYCTQPLMPIFSRAFQVSAAESSLALSLSTGCLAFSVFLGGAVSETLGRKRLMLWSMCLAAVLNLAAAFAPNWHLLLVIRALEGIVMGGVPAVGMAYLAEEVDPRGLGLAMGLYVGGNAFGGMIGRVLAGIVADHVSWEAAMAVVGVLGLVSAAGFAALLPPSRNFTGGRRMGPRLHVAAWIGHLRNPGLPLLFAMGFLLMGSFVTVYNYAGFRLEAPPFDLSQSEIGLIFVVYLFGILASSLAGGLADRWGRLPVMLGGVLVTMGGLALTLLSSIGGVVAGIAVVTIGFFAAHAVASGWVAGLARGAKGHATAFYLLAYYLGSSVMGSLGGWFWSTGGWTAVSGYVAAMLALSVLASLRIAALPKARGR
jgi:YNFM family putative membrane transporter